MTVTYTAEVSTCKKFGCFIKLLARWRGSIYKIIWMDLILFLALYYIINLIYSNLLENESKKTFESIVFYCANYTSLIPLSFVLGFYVSLVMTRWWNQYITIPWPDSIAVFVSAHVHGQDEGGRLMRRTVMRYICLCLTIVFTMISPCVKKRFPKIKNLVDAGLLLDNEKQIIEAMDSSFPNYPKHWMPIVWAASIITRARKEGRIRDDFAVKTIIDELNHFRGRCGTLMYYDFISIPLVYTQVVTIAVYSFFVCSLLAHQWTESKRDTYEALDFYSPIFITLQFFFYIGWLKVAETLINPFGEDDDDFEVNWMIDRNLQVSYLIVDEMHHEHPELVRDQYWDEVYPSELPYESEVRREQPPEPSTAKYDLADLSKRAASGSPSVANSATENGKTSFFIQNALSRRSQRFNEAFQRFLNYSEDDGASEETNVENKISFQTVQSVSEIENLEHITSYTLSDQLEFDSQETNTNVKQMLLMEPVIEENEELSEAVEENEMLSIEEENDDITQSSYQSDSDSDPFERLRIERQHQRLQRMNDYLERNFGSNFRIVTQFSEVLEKQYKNKTDGATDYNSSIQVGEILDEMQNEENISTPKISTEYITSNYKSTSSLIGVKNNKNLLTPKIEDTANDEDMLHEKNPLYRGDNGTLVNPNVTENNFPLEFSQLANTESQNAQAGKGFSQNILKNSSQVSFEQGVPSISRISNQSFLEQTSSVNATSRIITHSSSHSANENISTTQTEFTVPNDILKIISLTSSPAGSQVFAISTPLQHESPSTSTSTNQRVQIPKTQDVPNTPASSEGDAHKATSTVNSATNVTTPSSGGDDQVTLSPETMSVAGEYRVEIEVSEDENN